MTAIILGFQGRCKDKMGRFTGFAGTSLIVAVTLFSTFVAVVAPAGAQNYPIKPLRFITPSAQGGNADILTRVVADGLAKVLGQPVLTDNRPGGSASIGTSIAAKSPANGYTLLMISTSHAVNPSLFRDLPYDTARDFATVSMVGATPILLVINPGMPVTNIRELVSYAKARPGMLNFAYQNNGSQAHLGGELLNSLTGIKLVAVAYKGSAQATNDAIAGIIQIAFPSLSSVLPHVKSGKLRALGITSSKRSPLTPDIPTVAESVPGYESSIWSGVLVPAGTPRPIIVRLNAEIIKVLDSPDIRGRMAGMGVDIESSTPEAFGAFIDAEIRKWARVIRESGIHAELEP